MANQVPPQRWHPRLIEAAAALQENRLDVAERILKPHLKEDPFDVRAIRMLAELAARIGRMSDAETLLRRAIEIAPNFIPAKTNLAMVLGRTGRPVEALALVEEALALEPDGTGHVNLKAATLGRLGEFEESRALYEKVLERNPNQPGPWVSYGHLLKTIGRTEDGIAAYRKAISLRPALGEAWWSLANLKTFRFTADDVAAMQEALTFPDIQDNERFNLNFALGKAFHDLGDAAQAFANYSAGNALRRKYHPHDRQEVTGFVDRCIAFFTPEVLARPGGADAPDPIFVVGMPRAGSTLVEQILSSHSMVEGTAELPDMPMLARRNGRYPDSIAGLGPAQRAEVGSEYLRRTAVQRRSDRPFFVDKLPNNWMFAHFIHWVLPNAKIIDARRHPLACCFSNFRQHFARGQDFAYDLGDLGQYYSDYVRLMANVDERLPGRMHRVIYERMVEDPEGEIRSLLDYCGLPFEEQCLEFHKTERAVRTPSSEQVRRPIYKDATEEWRAYAAHLGELEDALGPVLDAYPEAPASFLQRS